MPSAHFIVLARLLCENHVQLGLWVRRPQWGASVTKKTNQLSEHPCCFKSAGSRSMTKQNPLSKMPLKLIYYHKTSDRSRAPRQTLGPAYRLIHLYW